MADDNPHIYEGANHPPVSPFDAVKVHVDDLMAEARQWLDGQPVTTQAQADGVSKLLDMLRKAKTATDNARKEEAKPFDDGKAEVQARYKPLLERAELAADTCKKALQPFLMAQEAARQAAAAEARRVAEEAARVAAETARAASRGDLEQQEDAEAAVKAARDAEAAAKAIDKSRSHATGGARATTLRTSYTPVLTDGHDAVRWAWSVHRPEMLEFVTSLAKTRMQGGVRQIPGFEIVAEQRVV